MSQKKEESKLPLKNHPGQGRTKSTTSNEDHYLFKLMKTDRSKSSRQLAPEWDLSNGKSISPRTVRRRLFNPLGPVVQGLYHLVLCGAKTYGSVFS